MLKYEILDTVKYSQKDNKSLRFNTTKSIMFDTTARRERR